MPAANEKNSRERDKNLKSHPLMVSRKSGGPSGLPSKLGVNGVNRTPDFKVSGSGWGDGGSRCALTSEG